MSNSSLNNAPRRPRSRTQSMSSDRPSTTSHSIMSPPLSVSPEAAFIAASAASQIVTNDHDSHSEAWYDHVCLEPSGETALVSPGALQLANNFIDQLLFNIIAVAGSTALAALRPAVSEVLKPKLAKDAINQADEELREYLGGGEVEDPSHPATESSNDWDVELAWKRTRLRCMIYSSLGDMEEEDEDQYMEQEHLLGESGDILSEFVSPAVAIFLTSILEFMGEQVLVISAQAAFNRMRAKHEKELKEGSRSRGDVADRVVVEELDMERVALDRTLGRLWRAWKKRIRTPAEPNFSRPFSRSSTAASGLTHARHGSTSTDWVTPGAVMENSSLEKDEAPAKSVDDTEIEKVAEIRPSAIPLPMSNNDIAEIEVPGLVRYSDEERSDDGDDEEIRRPTRPKSTIVYLPSSQIGPLAPTMSEPGIPAETPRRRANSLPTAVAPRYKSPSVNYDSPQVADTRQRHKISDKDGSWEGVHGKVESGGEDAAGLGLRLIDGAAAVGSAAVGLTAVATGAAPQTEADTGEIDDFVEEPEILTSSRISFAGRRSSAGSEPGVARPPSILIARSNSVRSARLIDVHSPRSPSVSSRANSFDNADRPRPSSISREGSVSTPTPPIPEEGELWCAPPLSTVKRNGFVLSADDHLDVNTISAPPPRARSPPKSVPSHSAGPTSATTKVTILNAPTPRSYSLPTAYLPQEIHDVPQKSSYKTPPLPTLPERSTGRQDHGRPDTMGATVAAQRGLPESPKVRRSVQADSPSSTTSNKLKAVRSSEDNGSHHSGDVVRNFEELIHSDQTLQYTLTPESMRSMDSNQPVNDHSPVTAHKSRKSEDAKLGESSRASSFKRSLSVSKPTGLSSHPPADTHIYGKVADQSPRPPAVSIPTKTRSGRVARDARVPVESTQDFVDFLRSTGPQGETGPPKRVRAGSVANARRASASVTSPHSTSMTSRPTSSATRARLQAREAAVAPSNGSSELIDFIRRGPQDSTGENPRIPRHVAPFRTTMDSDQMQMSGATGGRAVDAVLPDIRDSLASTNVTETSAPSSLNSQSALLSKANKPMAYSGNNFDDEDTVPKRKQRRVRDPYAVELSDEDDDLFEDVMHKPKAKQEESLIDFLNNCEPPPEPKPRPVVTPQTIPKKKSAPNLITRLRSGHSTGGSFSSLMGKGSNAVESRPIHSRASTGNGKAYTPIAVNIPPSGVGNFGNNFIAPPKASSPGTSAPARVPMKKFEPREAVLTATRTSDLASFLRDSEPPPSSITLPMAPTEEKPSHGFSRMFERRKKSVAY